MNRQEFLRTLAVAGAAAVVSLDGTVDVMAQTRAGNPGSEYDLVAALGGSPAELFSASIKRLGGMSRFVKPGQRVTIKPNIGWDKAPEFAADTNPELIGAIVKACLQAGAKEVNVFDHTCDSIWTSCYDHSGIEKAVEASGGKMIPGNDEQYYRTVSLPRGKALKTAQIHQAILDCDAWINVPVLKTHGGAKMTIAMKNLMGIVWDRRAFHQQGLQQTIADICTINKPPVLNIVDAFRVMKSNGPRGRSLGDVVNPKALFMSTDIVAVDTAATMFFNQIASMSLEDVGHLALGHELGAGTMDLSKLKISRIKL